LKKAINATNYVIRESSLYLIQNKTQVDGFYFYTSKTDGRLYVLQYKTWTDPTTASARMKIVVVSPFTRYSNTTTLDTQVLFLPLIAVKLD